MRWRTILEAYSAPDYYRLGSPSDVVYAIERLSDLIKVAHEIYQQLPGADFSGEAPEAATSIGNAHSAIRQFFEARSLEEWERCLRHVLFFALSTDDPDEGGCKEDTLGLYSRICGLVEGVGTFTGIVTSASSTKASSCLSRLADNADCGYWAFQGWSSLPAPDLWPV